MLIAIANRDRSLYQPLVRGIRGYVTEIPTDDKAREPPMAAVEALGNLDTSPKPCQDQDSKNHGVISG